MHIGLITLFPEMLDTLRCGGITARALEKGLLKLSTWNPRDFTQDKHRCVDDRPYGGGPGMVMQVQPLRAAIQAGLATLGPETRVIYLSPQGRRLDQAGVHILLNYQRLLLVAGRYEGIDERVIERDIDEEWSIGDYVLSGGELAAMVMIDALTRWLPGALGHEASATEDSFYAGLLDHPHYTRPEEIDGQSVPAVLLSGHHAQIVRWRQKQALGRTWTRHPELLEKLSLTPKQQTLLNEFIVEQTKGGL
ncbi:MAG: tRNA (guanosine(37)-N1)-methyltransferase TrmD [Candidatus Parabeggiatoa sp. nov. 3]|nr:MAG: tRNA (guanosine(37)-N1)-methyltransferase TrmD [Gammaproteobacteria bacterium]RKZ67877.1 MAG: tRNA (guanosine(37)-N1)-methyltransferase TrmD [Gammaproteobacteria bacterium]RKZ81534.1 MAG: tRNA (guanosine(37)-N1)-methyltransferase TrmD [Gammaproteobacteria bacterium]